MEQTPVFKIGDYLEEQHGLKFQGLTPEGTPTVLDGNGEIRKVNIDKLLASDQKLQKMGINPKSVDMQWNTPDTPVDKQSVGLAGNLNDLFHRAAMTQGNAAGNVDYLKKQKGKDGNIYYDDVQYHPSNGIVAKRNGVWERMDPEGSDPWELTKDIVEVAVKNAPAISASIIGGTVGALAGPAGSIAGAGLASAGSEAIRISMGRLLGTYKATEEEVMRDIGTEFLFNAGGQAIGLAVKPTLQMLSKAAKNIKEWAAPGTKELLAKTYGAYTGSGPVATKILIENPTAVPIHAKRALSVSGGDAHRAAEMLKAETVATTREMLEAAPAALSKKWNELQDVFLDSVPNNFKADIAPTILETMGDMQGKGLGTIMVGEETAEAVMKRAQLSGVKPDITPSKTWFKLASKAEMDTIVESGRIDDFVNKDVLKALDPYIDTLNTFMKAPQATGKMGAKNALTIKKELSAVAFDVKEKYPEAVRHISELSVKVNNALTDKFVGTSAEAPFKAMNKMYSESASVVDEAKRILNSGQGLETFVDKLASPSGKNALAKNFSGELVDLLGGKAQSQIDDLSLKYSASQFVSWVPNVSKLGAIGATAGITAGAVSGAISGGTAFIAASQSMPKLVMKQFEYSSILLKHLQTMPKSKLVSWLDNPQVVGATLATIGEAYQAEEERTKIFLEHTVGGQQGGQ